MKSLLVLRRAPERSDFAYESGNKDVWFDHRNLMGKDLTPDPDREGRGGTTFGRAEVWLIAVRQRHLSCVHQHIHTTIRRIDLA